MDAALPWWVVITIVFFAFVAFAHARKYFRSFQQQQQQQDGSSTQIVQASLADITSDVLSEWSPLIVQDRLVDPVAALTSTLLRWQYIWKGPVRPVSTSEVKSVCRFTLIFASPPEGSTVILKNLKDTTTDPGVEVRLSPGRILVLPPGFLYASGNLPGSPPPSQVRFHDSSTAFLSWCV